MQTACSWYICVILSKNYWTISPNYVNCCGVLWSETGIRWNHRGTDLFSIVARYHFVKVLKIRLSSIMTTLPIHILLHPVYKSAIVLATLCILFIPSSTIRFSPCISRLSLFITICDILWSLYIHNWRQFRNPIC